MRKFCVLILLSTLAICPNQTFAANSPIVYHDGNLLQNVQIKNDCTYIPLRDICQIISFDSASRSVSVQHSAGAILSLQTGSKTATLTQNENRQYLTLAAAPYISNATTYVPLRSTCETLGYTVYWDNDSKTTVVYQQDSPIQTALNGHDLPAARNAVISLPRIETFDMKVFNQFEAQGENISHNIYYFPYGESRRFIVSFFDTLSCYEAHDGAAWLIWQGKTDSNNNILTEAGIRPDFGTRQVYFNDFFQADTISYGIIKNGQKQQIAEIKDISIQSPDGNWRNRMIFQNIDSESKID